MTDAQPAGPPADEPPRRRAGRNLPAAIAIGVALGAAVVVSLFTRKTVFVGLTTVAVMVAVTELCRALRARTPGLPLVPLVAGSAVVLVTGYVGGTEALVVATLLLVVAAVLWCVVVEGPVEGLAAAGASIFVACYVAFLAGFAVLLAVPADGPRRVLTFVAIVVCSDTGGYGVGVVLGRHPMAPSVSPKKSWEGFAGSVSACVACGALMVPLVLHGSWWQGVLLGLAVVVAATLGDLGESLVKRDLGIKDMGHLLPGHGGSMDRLDSLLVAAPVAWALLTVFVPWPK